MLIPPYYTPIQIIVPDDNQCISVYHRWRNIYLTNQDTYSYISHLSLARKYNLIYTLIKTKNLKLLNYPYTEVPLISAENINFYKLNNNIHLLLKEENDIQEVINTDGTQIWLKSGERHRDNDLPALIKTNGTQLWYKNGKFHRDNDFPAAIYPDGTQAWHQNGKCHRDNDLPAITYTSGRKEWFRHGVKYDYPS